MAHRQQLSEMPNTQRHQPPPSRAAWVRFAFGAVLHPHLLRQRSPIHHTFPTLFGSNPPVAVLRTSQPFAASGGFASVNARANARFSRLVTHKTASKPLRPACAPHSQRLQKTHHHKGLSSQRARVRVGCRARCTPTQLPNAAQRSRQPIPCARRNPSPQTLIQKNLKTLPAFGSRRLRSARQSTPDPQPFAPSPVSPQPARDHHPAHQPTRWAPYPPPTQSPSLPRRRHNAHIFQPNAVGKAGQATNAPHTQCPPNLQPLRQPKTFLSLRNPAKNTANPACGRAASASFVAAIQPSIPTFCPVARAAALRPQPPTHIPAVCVGGQS